MILICKKTVYGLNDYTLFSNGLVYTFVAVNNRYTKLNNFIGFIKKDDEKNKKWLTKEFKEIHFAECKENEGEIYND